MIIRNTFHSFPIFQTSLAHTHPDKSYHVLFHFGLPTSLHIVRSGIATTTFCLMAGELLSLGVAFGLLLRMRLKLWGSSRHKRFPEQN